LPPSPTFPIKEALLVLDVENEMGTVLQKNGVDDHRLGIVLVLVLFFGVVSRFASSYGPV